MKRLLIAGLLALTSTTAALPQSWSERPYDPPAGSRWIVQVDMDTTDTQQDRTQTMQIKARSELTIEGKTADGFRISYALRDITVEGTAPTVNLIGPAFSGLRDIVVRGAADAAGKPVRVDNVAEVQTAMRGVIARTVAGLGQQPRVQAMMQDLMTSMLIVDGQRATEVYFGEVPLLALGQNTGLKPGEVRQASDQVQNPMGGAPLKAEVTIRIDQADAQSGNVRYVRTRNLDPEGVKEFAAGLVRRMGIAGDMEVPPQLLEIIKGITLTMDNRSEVEVEGGATRLIREETKLDVNAAGQRVLKHERKLITVSPAP